MNYRKSILEAKIKRDERGTIWLGIEAVREHARAQDSLTWQRA